jgi:hypothetical protein
VTEPLLTVEIGGEEFLFMVDTGAMVSIVQPGISEAQVRACDVQARGVTGTQLDIIGEQTIEFIIRNKGHYMVLTHTFIVSPLKRCSSGILGMDFLQSVGAGISLTSRSLTIDRYSFPLTDWGSRVSKDHRLINEGQEGLGTRQQEGRNNETVEEWVGTVELAGTVMVPPLSVRIARGRVIRRSGSTVKVPRNQVVLVDPECLPGVYMARLVATLEVYMSSSGTRGLEPLVGKSPLVDFVSPPPCENIASSDGNKQNTGTGEHLPEEPEGGLFTLTTVNQSDLQAQCNSFPVESVFGRQVDTHQNFRNRQERQDTDNAQGQGITKTVKPSENFKENTSSKRSHLIGFVPIHIVNLSLEEVELSKHMYIGLAAPICCEEIENPQDCRIRIIQAEKDNQEISKQQFQEYMQDKLAHLPSSEQQILQPVLQKYSHLFYGIGSTDIGCTSQVQHAIETGDARPIKRNPYRIPHVLKPVVDEQIDDLLRKGIIEPSMSPWSSSIVLVQKKTKDGSVKHRLCIDYRALNAVTKPDAYPIPNIVDTLDSLGCSKIFTVLDMASGYHQVEVEPQSREKTAFSCYKGHYQFIKMPFGLNNAPATYQRCMDVILMGLKGIDCLVYLDDIICFSATMEEHVQKLEAIFERLDQANFRIQPEKCVFATDTVDYLGHVCTPFGIRPDPNKIKAIRSYPVPKTVRDVRAFIGLAGYYRRHVRNFAEIARSLTNLTKKDVFFNWTNDCQQAFDKLKEILSTEPLLIYPDFSQPFIVACDASTKAVGAVLSQLRNGEERPIAYCSRQLNLAESKYSVTELELLAFIFATKQFRCYLYGRRFTVYTDHSFKMAAEPPGSEF